MVLPCSGSISLLNIQNEYGGSNPIGLNEYYRNGAYVLNNNKVPTSGTISFADFLGINSYGSATTGTRPDGLRVWKYTGSSTFKICTAGYVDLLLVGGGTEFPHKTFKPDPGYGLFFPSNWCFPHSGQKVLEGKKRVAVTWYYVNDTST